MSNLTVLAAASSSSSSGMSLLTSFLPMLIILVVFYFMLIRPQSKKDKALKKMREELSIGDEITTIGGIVGRVVSIKDDTILIESGSDRTKVRIKKFAVQEVEKIEID
ncbi:preprotein translocase subunit YajC [Neobittarella massiliensis]|uniref:Preprotein translocase subunit YajC n=1 Tax=Neobittarella massiliensis (ex Bilen et al. 2018) TaxID=2041842 RepID=A0A8J6IMY7_9FIRM|nr:preprotein translocase subunit YajC [Neobittarella massiliensis]MBC3515772.1 preprotein translocase subunit YajC [Neobittarella massiliensis]